MILHTKGYELVAVRHTPDSRFTLREEWLSGSRAPYDYLLRPDQASPTGRELSHSPERPE